MGKGLTPINQTIIRRSICLWPNQEKERKENRTAITETSYVKPGDTDASGEKKKKDEKEKLQRKEDRRRKKEEKEAQKDQ